MEIKEKITLDMLTEDSVSILRQQFLDYNGIQMQVGDNVRNTYMNDTEGRAKIKEILPEEYYNAVIAVWGDTPTIAESAEVI